jgi:ligand-binding sensor domain-containing protein
LIRDDLIDKDSAGTLWVGTYGQGLKRFDRRTGEFKALRSNPAEAPSSSSNIFFRLFIDHTGTLLAGTWDGLKRFDHSDDQRSPLTSSSLLINSSHYP